MAHLQFRHSCWCLCLEQCTITPNRAAYNDSKQSKQELHTNTAVAEVFFHFLHAMCSWSFDTHLYNGIWKWKRMMFVEKRATVNHIAFMQPVCTSSLSPGERWLWHSCQAYLSLAEGHGQEQQLTHSKSHITPACKNLSTHNKPLILIFTPTKKLHSGDKCLTIWKYILRQFKKQTGCILSS